MTIKRIRLLIPLALAALAAIPAACGSNTETVKFGNEEVSIPSNLHTVGARIRAVLEQQPYEKWAVDCLAKQYQKVLPPATEDRLRGASETELAEFFQPHLAAMSKACERPGRHVLDPNASTAQLETIRAAQAAGLRFALEGANVADGEIECVEERFERLPMSRVIAAVEAPEAKREVIYSRLALGCEGR